MDSIDSLRDSLLVGCGRLLYLALSTLSPEERTANAHLFRTTGDDLADRGAAATALFKTPNFAIALSGVAEARREGATIWTLTKDLRAVKKALEDYGETIL